MMWNCVSEIDQTMVNQKVCDEGIVLLKKICEHYEEDWERKPTLQEIEYILELSLQCISLDLVNEFENKEVKKVSIKTKVKK